MSAIKYYGVFVLILSVFFDKSQGALVQDIQTALTLGNSSIEYNREDCNWRANGDRQACPDPDLRFILYTSKGGAGEEIDLKQSDFFRTSSFDPILNSVVLVHGYAGGDNTFPMSMLRDAYIRNGSYNVIVLDWGKLGPMPCYPAAVHNLKTAAKCSAVVFNMLRDAAPGNFARTTCVGHSLGAHLCGLISEYLIFRMQRIIALDPARPLIRNSIKLKPGDAEEVQVIHTNAGNFGEIGRLGKVDFCLNGGRIQPLCDKHEKAELCSHLMAVCFMAASINSKTSLIAHPCARRCPSSTRPTHRLGQPVVVGEHTPPKASGFYCAATRTQPYCPTKEGDEGHPWCCLDGNTDFHLEVPAPPLTAESEIPSDDEQAKITSF